MDMGAFSRRLKRFAEAVSITLVQLLGFNLTKCTFSGLERTNFDAP